MFQKMLRTVGTVVLASVSLSLPQVLTGQAASSNASSLVTNRLTQPIHEKSLVTLKETVHPLARAANDRGAAPDTMALDRLQIVLKRSDAQEAALKQLISDMHTPGKASYHKWLTPAQFGEQFGASDQDIQTVETWLQAKGFAVTKVNAGKQTLEVSGNAGQFRDAFHAQIHKYVVNGETHYANATDPQIPAALSPVFGGFASLNNFKPRRMSRTLGKATYQPKTDKATPQWTVAANSFALAPGDFAVQYDLNPLYSAGTNGSGQTIGIINDANINIANVNLYRSLFQLPANPPQVMIDGNDPGIDGVNNPDGPNGDSIESYLDVEVAGSVAPAATVDLVIAADTSLESGLILAAEHAVYGNVAPVLSMSFGVGCEAELGTSNAFLSDLWEQAAAQGITVMVSAGDNGSAGCDDDNTQYYAVNGSAISGLASTPYNVAVGGTDFYYSDYATGGASASNYWNPTPSGSSYAVSLQTPVPEQPWNDSQYGLDALNYYNLTGDTTIAGGSGGVSTCGNATEDSSSNVSCAGYAKPVWQTGTGVPADKVRDIPDVSLFAADGLNNSYYVICAADADCQTGGSAIQVTGVGGTSASSPAFAGIMALVNQKYGPQGQANFVLYPMAAQFPAAFHDVTVGNNSEPCNTTTVSDGEYLYAPTNCISVSDGLTVTDPTYGATVEGQLGAGTTPSYRAGVGYDTASGLGSVDANVLVSNWGNVTFKPTNVTFTPSSTSFTHGTAITFSGSVKPTPGTATPTGDVALMTDSTEDAQQGQTYFTLTSGSFSGKSVNFLPGGTYNVWGHYGGDTANAGADSDKTQITVAPENSTTTLSVNDVATGYGNGPAITSGTGSIPYGTQLMLSALATPSSCGANCTSTYTSPTGTVAFADNSQALNTAVVNTEGDAEYNGNWAVGSHSVTAAYSGDQSYNKSSNASPFTFTVVKNTPQINVASSYVTTDGSLIGGQSTVVTIQILNSANLNSESNYSLAYSNPTAAPTGTVTVSGFPSGVATSATLQAVQDGASYSAGAVATFVLPSTTATGTYNLTISYPGDGNYNAASSKGSVGVEAAGGTATTTTASVTGSISPTTQVVLTGTVTGTSAHGAPTGYVEVYSAGYELGTLGLTASSGTSSTFTTGINSESLLQGNNQLTVQYLGDKNYAPSSYTFSTAISNPLSDFSMVPNATIVPVAAGSSATDTIQLSSTNSFSGAVGFACTAANGVSCSISPASSTFTGGAANTAVLTITADSATAAGNYNVLVTATGPNGLFVHTLGITAAVAPGSGTPAMGFSLTNNGNLSLAAGATTSNTGTINVNPLNGFTGTVSLACTVAAPTGAAAPATCSVTPSVSISGATAATGTVTITTTAASTSAMVSPWNKLFAIGGSIAAAGLLFFGIPARRRSWRTMLGVIVFAMIVGFGITGCGSGSSSTSGGGGCGRRGGGGGGTTTATTAGNYIVTVTGTSGSTTASTNVTVTVN